MPIEITMPRLSDTMEEGTLIKWRVAKGDKVASGDHLADVETDKATMELNTFDDGTVARLAAEEGATVPVGDLILLLAEEGEDVEAAAASQGSGNGDQGSGGKQKKEEAKDKPEPAEAKGEIKTGSDASDSDGAPSSSEGSDGGSEGGGRLRVSPLARKLADEHGVDIANVKGTGPDGRIIKRDVLNAAKGGGEATTKPTPDDATEQKPAEPASAGVAAPAKPQAAPSRTGGLESKSIKLSNMRKTIAKRLVESKTTVPHFQVSTDVNMDPLLELRATINGQLESQGIKLSVNDFITKAIAVGCLEHPAVNSSWAGDTIEQHGTVNVGVAISLPPEKGGGLLVATLRDAQDKGLRQISREVKDLAKHARGEKGLTVEQMSDSTITISNLGMPQYGVTQFNAIVNPPNAAIVAVGAAIEKPVVRDGQIVVGHEMNMTLSGDHRVIDGASGAEYLATVRRLLENPAALLV